MEAKEKPINETKSDLTLQLKALGQSTYYQVLVFIVTIVITILDLWRVGFFTSESDPSFIVATIILLLVLAVNICVNMTTEGYFLTLNGAGELIFFGCCVLSSPLSSYNYTLYLVACYVKIVNVVRVSAVLLFFQQREKVKLTKKLQKEKIRIRSLERHHTQMLKDTKQSLIYRKRTSKRGEKIREWYNSKDAEGALERSHSQIT